MLPLKKHSEHAAVYMESRCTIQVDTDDDIIISLLQPCKRIGLSKKAGLSSTGKRDKSNTLKIKLVLKC